MFGQGLRLARKKAGLSIFRPSRKCWIPSWRQELRTEAVPGIDVSPGLCPRSKTLRQAPIEAEEERTPAVLGRAVVKAIQDREPAKYWLYQLAELHGDERQYTKDKRFICKECCSIFSSLLL